MDFEQLAVFRLGQGSHRDPSKGVCAMEAVAWLEGLPHTDQPACTCPVIAEFVRTINDNMPDDVRQRLVAYLPRLVGTVSSEHERERAEYLAQQAERVGWGIWAVHAARYLTNGDWVTSAQCSATAIEGIWDAAFAMLDGVLAIGPQSPGFSADTAERVAAFRELVTA